MERPTLNDSKYSPNGKILTKYYIDDLNKFIDQEKEDKKALIENIKEVRDRNFAKKGAITGRLYDELTELIK